MYQQARLKFYAQHSRDLRVASQKALGQDYKKQELQKGEKHKIHNNKEMDTIFFVFNRKTDGSNPSAMSCTNTMNLQIIWI